MKRNNNKKHFTQRAVSRNGGRNSSKILLYLQRQWLVPAAVETRHCCEAAATLTASGGQRVRTARENKVESRSVI